MVMLAGAVEKTELSMGLVMLTEGGALDVTVRLIEPKSPSILPDWRQSRSGCNCPEADWSR